MAGARSIRAGEAYVELYGDDTRLQRSLANAQRRMRRFGRDAMALGGGMFGAVSAAVAPITAISLKAASDAQEIRHRFKVVFGEQAAEAAKFADDLANAVGRSGTKVRDTMSNFMAFFVGLGFGREESRQLSQELASLALDFASFNNLSDTEAATRLISAMSGSVEVVDKFGINLKQAALDVELLRMGLKENTQTASETTKALARYSIITRALGQQGAVGDAVRTAGHFANQQRRAKDELFDLADTIGQAFLPTATAALQVTSGTVQAMSEWVRTNGDVVRTVAATAAVVAGLGAAVFALGLGFVLLANPIALTAAGAMGVAASVAAIAEATGVVERLAMAFADSAVAAQIAGDTVVQALASGQFDDAWSAVSLGFSIAMLEAIDEVTSYLAKSFSGLLGVDTLIDGLSGAMRARLESLRSQLGAQPGGTDTPAGALIDDMLSRMRGVGPGNAIPNIGSLSGETVLNQLAGAGPDRVATDVRSIARSVTDIARSVDDLGRFT